MIEVQASHRELSAKQIGQRIAVSRKELDGMTQRELADLVGVTERSVAAWELGENIPYRHMSRLADVLGRPAAWLLYGDDANPVDLRELLLEIRTDLKTILSKL